MNAEMRERPFAGPGWDKPDREPELSVWRRFVDQLKTDIREIREMN